MARGVNKVIIVGNLGQDPSVTHMPNGNAVANITVATSESWKDQQGQPQEKTEWHKVVLYKRLAEIAGEYLRKGSKIYLEGKLQTRGWEKDGVKRYTTEIVCHEMQMLDGKSAGGAAPAGAAPAANRPQQQRPATGAAPTYNEPPMDFDEDMPFAPIGLQYRELLNAC